MIYDCAEQIEFMVKNIDELGNFGFTKTNIEEFIRTLNCLKSFAKFNLCKEVIISKKSGNLEILKQQIEEVKSKLEKELTAKKDNSKEQVEDLNRKLEQLNKMKLSLDNPNEFFNSLFSKKMNDDENYQYLVLDCLFSMKIIGQMPKLKTDDDKLKFLEFLRNTEAINKLLSYCRQEEKVESSKQSLLNAQNKLEEYKQFSSDVYPKDKMEKEMNWLKNYLMLMNLLVTRKTKIAELDIRINDIESQLNSGGLKFIFNKNGKVDIKRELKELIKRKEDFQNDYDDVFEKYKKAFVVNSRMCQTSKTYSLIYKSIINEINSDFEFNPNDLESELDFIRKSEMRIRLLTPPVVLKTLDREHSNIESKKSEIDTVNNDFLSKKDVYEKAKQELFNTEFTPFEEEIKLMLTESELFNLEYLEGLYNIYIKCDYPNSVYFSQDITKSQSAFAARFFLEILLRNKNIKTAKDLEKLGIKISQKDLEETKQRMNEMLEEFDKKMTEMTSDVSAIGTSIAR